MGKYYIVEEAELVCQYGSKRCKLRPGKTRHICGEEGRRLANISDIYPENFEKDFDSCCSPYQINYKEMNESIKSIYELNPLLRMMGQEAVPCTPMVAIPWQGGKENVHIGLERYEALVEDGWTICAAGKGIITMVNSGQGEEEKELLLRKLEELEAMVEEYCANEGLGEAQKQAILTNQLVYHGYSAQAKSWKTKSDPESRKFADYLRERNPSLMARFEQGIYVKDYYGESIDLTYMAGLNEARRQGKEYYEMLNPELLGDRGMYNAYLEVGRQQPGQGTMEMMKGMIEQCSQPEENPYGRYEEFYQRSAQVQVTQRSHADMLSTHLPTMEELEAAAQREVDEEALKQRLTRHMVSQTLVDQKQQFITDRKQRNELGRQNAIRFLEQINADRKGGE